MRSVFLFFVNCVMGEKTFLSVLGLAVKCYLIKSEICKE